MADLRDSFFNQRPAGELTAADLEALDASGMSDLGRGWETGRLGNEANYLAAQESSLRAEGRAAEADALRAEIATLQQRQGRYAPQVGRVEDISGPGTGLRWAAGQVGQGAASMVDPAAAGAAAALAGRGLAMVPHPLAKAAGAGLSALGAPAAAYGISQRQLRGEFLNEAARDPELMARTSPQELDDTATAYGLAAGALDAVVPGRIGGQVAGAGLRRGLRPASAAGVLARTAGGSAVEGATELGQTMGSQYTRGVLNPNRDTSGDFMEGVNAFAGGAVGGAPMVAAGEVADAGYRRTGAVADAVTEKAGEMVDLASAAGGKVGEMAGNFVGSAKAKVGETVDLLKEDGVAGTFERAKQGAKQGAQDLGAALNKKPFALSPDELSLLDKNAAPPDGASDEWLLQRDDERVAFVQNKLAELADDPHAQDILQRMGGQDPAQVWAAADEGAQYVTDRSDVADLEYRAKQAAEALGGVAATAGKAAGKAALGTARLLGRFAKAAIEGAKGKRNMQADEAPIQGDPAAKEASLRRAEQFASMLSGATRKRMAGRASMGDPDNVANFMRDVGYEISDLADSWGLIGGKAKPSRAAASRQAPGLVLALDSIANSLRVALGPDAESAINEMQALVPDASAAPLFDHLREAVADSGTPVGRKASRELRMNAANQMLAMMPEQRMKEILQNEAAQDERAQYGRKWLVDTVEQIARGHVSPALRKTAEEAFGGREVLNRMVEFVNTVTPAAQREKTVNDAGTEITQEVNDDGEVDDTTSDYEKRQADKSVSRRAQPSVYGFSKSPTLRGGADKRDVFSPLEKGGKLPSLFRKDEMLSDGETRAIDKKVMDMEARLGAEYQVRGRSAYDVLKDRGVSESRMLSLYRDYVQQGVDGLTSDEQQTMKESALKHLQALSAVIKADQEAAGMTRDRLVMTEGERSTPSADMRVTEAQAAMAARNKARGPAATPEMREKAVAAAKKFFSERFVAVADAMTDADNSAMPMTELMQMGRAGKRVVAAAAAPGADNHVYAKNIITFKSQLVGRGGVPGDLHVSANSLAGWVKKQRLGEGQGADNSNARTFINDLSAGISMLLASGMVEPVMPTRMGVSFEGGIPDKLLLPSGKEYGQLKFAKGKAADIRRPDPKVASQEAVAEDQARGEIFVPDTDLPGREGRAAEATEDGILFSQLDGNKIHEDSATPLDKFPDADANEVAGIRAQSRGATRAQLARRVATSGVPAVPKDLAQSMKRFQEFIADPPHDYTTDRARQIVVWAEQQLPGLRAAREVVKDKDDAEFDRLSGLMYDAEGLIADAKKVIAGDESLESAPEVAARAPKPLTSAGLLNRQDKRDGNSRIVTDEEMQAAKDYVRKVLGKDIQVKFKEITGYSGEWIEADNAIEISTTAAAGAMQTAYHEALHAFFGRYVRSNAQVMAVAQSLVTNERIHERLVALLKDYPAAVAQLSDGEERLAYIYQFWAAGLLQLGVGKERTFLQKVGKFFREVFGMVSESDRAVALFEAFHAGKLADPSAAGKVIQKILGSNSWTVKARRNFDALIQGAAAATLASEQILLNNVSPCAQKLAREFFTNPGDQEAGKEDEGYLNARRREAMRYANLFAVYVKDLSRQDLKEVVTYLQQAKDPSEIAYAPHAEAVKNIRALLDRFYTYMKERGVDVGYIEKYYPVMWSLDKLVGEGDKFVQMLMDNYGDVLQEGVDSAGGKISRGDVARRILNAIIDNRGDNKVAPQREDGVLVPFFESGEGRSLDWIKPEHREPFLEKNLIAQMTRYFHQGARRAEYASRFGEDGKLLDGALREVENELQAVSRTMLQNNQLKDEPARQKWVERQVRDVRHAVGAMEGTLGKDISPTLRKLNSYMTVYQNLRLLPLALFSSFVDTLGIVARGGEMSDAYKTFLGGMKEVFRVWRNTFRDEPIERQRTEWDNLAEIVGAVDSELFSHYISEEYSSGYMTPTAKKINDKMFVFNGMEAWNRSMRVAGTRAAVLFIQKHKGLPDHHSKRWLAELGLASEDVVLDADGRLIVDRHALAAQEGISLVEATERMRKIHYAINRWVEGAVLTPNAAQRPSWASDPRYSIFFHLKQFTYSFHRTVLKRAVGELDHGNLAPMGVFAWYIPVMIAADVMKGLIVGGGELPNYMKAYGPGDWVMHGAQRSGLLGVGTIGVDAQADLASIGGPAVEQAIDAMRDPLERSTFKALPAHGLFRGLAEVE